MNVVICRTCLHGTDDPDKANEHLGRMLVHTAIAQALVMIHGPQRGLERLMEAGGVLHGPPEWLSSLGKIEGARA